MKLETLESTIKAKKLSKQILIFSGPENFLKERSISKLIDAYIPNEHKSESVFRLTCSNKNQVDILNQIFSFSFVPCERVFVIYSIDTLTSKNRKDLLQKIQKGGVNPDSFLIFPTNDSKSSTEANKIFGKEADKTDFWQPFENKLPTWISSEAKELGIKLKQDAIMLLLELLGADLKLLFQELTKLSVFKRNSTITIEDVKSQVSYQKQETISNLLNYCGQRKRIEAIRVVESLSAKGEAPQRLWASICNLLRSFRSFHDTLKDRPDLLLPIAEKLDSIKRNLTKTDFKSNMDRKNLISQIQSEAESFPPALSSFLKLSDSREIRKLSNALNFKRSELTNLWPELIEMEKALKGGSIDPKASLQNFIAKHI